MKKLIALFALLIAGSAGAAPFDKGNVAEGKKLHDQQCAACHAGHFDGDAGKMYTRTHRRVNSAAGLAQMITTCNANLGNAMFPEDEMNIGAYLNATYYKFK
jgi:cytochrome c5